MPARPKARSKDRPEELMLLGRAIAELRKETRLSQEGFSHHAKLERAQYAGYERGAANPTALTMVRIAEALGVSVSQIWQRYERLGGKPKPGPR